MGRPSQHVDVIVAQAAERDSDRETTDHNRVEDHQRDKDPPVDHVVFLQKKISYFELITVKLPNSS